MPGKYSLDYVFLIIPIIIIILVGWIIYTIYIPVPVDTSSQKICMSGQDCSKKNLSITIKDNLTEAQKKLSPDLLQLIGIIDLPAGMTRETLEQQMILEHSLIRDNQSGVLVVQTYIYLNDNEQIPLLTPIIFDLKHSDLENHILVAWVDVNNLTQVATFKSVRSIRTIIPPVSN